LGPLAVGSGFWVLQGQRFATLRQESIRHSKKPFGASYHPDEGWGLEDFGAFYGRCAGRWLLDDGTREDVEEFKSIAAVCAVAVGAPNTDNAWVEWLDCGTEFEPVPATRVYCRPTCKLRHERQQRPLFIPELTFDSELPETPQPVANKNASSGAVRSTRATHSDAPAN